MSNKVKHSKTKNSHLSETTDKHLRHLQTESFVICISDTHIGKATPQYNLQIAEKLIRQLCQTIMRLNFLLTPTYNFDEFVIFSLGDILDGSDIYPTQTHHQEISAMTAQAVAGAELLLPLIETGLQIAPKVRFVGVAGNHGRSGKSAHEASNWDITLYQQLELICKTKYPGLCEFDYNAPVVKDNPTRVEYPDLFWLKLTKVKNHYFVLYHGHGTRSAYGIPYYGLMRRAHKWRTALAEKWKVMVVGHFHQFGWIEENDVIILLNGTLVKGDVWALETLGLRGINKFWCFGVSEKHPITWQFAIEI